MQKTSNVILLVSICFLVTHSPNFAIASTVHLPGLEELITKDVLGYSCINEEDLDIAFRVGGKEGVIPQTCLSSMPVSPDCSVLVPLLGRESKMEECGSFKYRWFRRNDPERTLFVKVADPIDREIIPTPTPASLSCFFAAFFLVLTIRLRKFMSKPHRQQMTSAARNGSVAQIQ